MVRGCLAVCLGILDGSVYVCVCVYQILASFSSLWAAITLCTLSIHLKCTSKGAIFKYNNDVRRDRLWIDCG